MNKDIQYNIIQFIHELGSIVCYYILKTPLVRFTIIYLFFS